MQLETWCRNKSSAVSVIALPRARCFESVLSTRSKLLQNETNDFFIWQSKSWRHWRLTFILPSRRILLWYHLTYRIDSCKYTTSSMVRWHTLKGSMSLQNRCKSWMLYRESAIEGGSPNAKLLQGKSSGQYRDIMEVSATPSVKSLRSFILGNFGTSCKNMEMSKEVRKEAFSHIPTPPVVI